MTANLPISFLAGVLLPMSVLAATTESGNATNGAGLGRAATNAVLRRSDAKGNPLRRAATGHVSNYDEAKVGSYTLPDPLVLQSGKPVRDAKTWAKQRRPEILSLYETEIYGRVPKRAPKVKFEVAETVTNALDGAAIHKHVVGRIGNGADAPKLNVSLYLPANINAHVPVILHMTFFSSAGS